MTTIDTATRAAAAPGSTTASTTSDRLGKTAHFTLAAVIAVLFIIPVAWTILRSLQSGAAAAGGLGSGMFDGLDLSNYTALEDSGIPIWSYTLNSAIVAIGTVVLTTVCATLAGYGLARLKFPGSGVIFVLILTPFMVPFQGILTPLFTMMDATHLTDTLYGLILVYITSNAPSMCATPATASRSTVMISCCCSRWRATVSASPARTAA